MFYNKFYNSFQNCFPLMKVKSKYLNRKPWLSRGLKQSIKVKNKMYVKSIRVPTIHNIEKYKKYRNKLNSILCKAQQDHYEKLLNENRANLSKSWKIIKEVINGRTRSTLPEKFIIDSKNVIDKNVIADTFNNFFVNVGLNIAKEIPNDGIDPCSFIKSEILNTFFINPVDSVDVMNAILFLKNTLPGYDGITSRVVKETCHLYIESLTHIINLSFIQGVFPKELKIAKVIPLFKSDDPSLIKKL